MPRDPNEIDFTIRPITFNAPATISWEDMVRTWGPSPAFINAPTPTQPPIPEGQPMLPCYFCHTNSKHTLLKDAVEKELWAPSFTINERVEWMPVEWMPARVFPNPIKINHPVCLTCKQKYLHNSPSTGEGLIVRPGIVTYEHLKVLRDKLQELVGQVSNMEYLLQNYRYFKGFEHTEGELRSARSGAHSAYREVHRWFNDKRHNINIG